MSLCSLHQYIKQYLNNLLTHKWHRPREYVHVVRKYEWMRCVVVLLDLYLVVLKSEHGRLVVIYVAVVRR